MRLIPEVAITFVIALRIRIDARAGQAIDCWQTNAAVMVCYGTDFKLPMVILMLTLEVTRARSRHLISIRSELGMLKAMGLLSR